MYHTNNLGAVNIEGTSCLESEKYMLLKNK